VSEELATPLLDLVKKLAATPIDGPAAKLKERFREATGEIVVLCDCSGSMEDLIGSANMSKFTHLQIALDDVLLFWPRIKLVGFASRVKEYTDAKRLPDPSSGVLGNGTDLAAGIKFCAARWKPRKTIVISDGLPDSQEEALKAAQKITGAIDTIYCGPDGHPACDFLRQLSKETAGEPHICDFGRKGIAGYIKGLLPAPQAIEL
jgi:hypothetical protein